VVAVGLVIGLGAACGGGSSATVKDTWVAPGVTTLDFEKVAVVMVDKDESTTRIAEDAMVKRFRERGIQAVPSYQLAIAPDAMQDAGAVTQALRDQGFDGVLVMRIVGTRAESTYVPGSYPDYYYGFGPYYSGAWGSPGYVDTDTYTTLETNLYSLETDQLVWAAQSEAVDVENVKELVEQVASAAGKKLQEQGLMPAEATPVETGT
jgi:hypothetical protein